MLRILLIGLVLMLSACVSAPANIHYYLLNTSSAVAVSDIPEQSIKVQLAEIILADYLQQPHLILQLKDNQIYYSPQDAWAENLQLAMAKALLSDLNQTNTAIQYVNYGAPHQGKTRFQLVLEVNHFQPTDASMAIAQGSYWLLDGATDQPLIHKTFALQLELEQDGYAHAVIQLRHLLTSLSQQISDDLTKIITGP
jgi:uncharacterized lipoprotein YmbA